LIDRKLEAEKAMDDAINDKTNLEAEIVTLEDLKFSPGIPESIVAEIEAQIAEKKTAITEAEGTINTAQQAFNVIAKQTIEVKEKRDAEEAAAVKQKDFLNAEADWQYWKGLVNDTRESL